MRVTCKSIDEFLEDLESQVKRYGPKCVFHDTVRASTFVRPWEGYQGRSQECIKFDVIFQASAVITTEVGDYLLEVGTFCGNDFRDSKPETEGSQQAAEMEARLRSFCESNGLRLGPGVIEP